MASGKSAEKIYDLIEELGHQNSDLVLADLIKFLNSDTLISFEEYFRSNHNMTIYESQISLDLDDNDPTEDFEENSFKLCTDCQDSYDANLNHICLRSIEEDEKTIPPTGSSKFFSSLIPEC